MKRTVSNPLGLAVMAWLLVGAMHPYELGRRLVETGKDRNIRFNRGSLYMVIKQLHRAGFVAPQETVRDSALPERTVYALTPEGRIELFDWMHDLVGFPTHEYPQFGVALSLISILAPEDTVDLLRRRLEGLAAEEHETRAAKDAAIAAGSTWIFLVEDDYRLCLLEAEQRFVAGLIESLQQPGYAEAWHDFFRTDT